MSADTPGTYVPIGADAPIDADAPAETETPDDDDGADRAPDDEDDERPS